MREIFLRVDAVGTCQRGPPFIGPCNHEPTLFPLRDNVTRTHPPVVVWTILALNIAVFAYQLGLNERELQIFLYQHALVPVRYFRPGWARELGLSPTDFSPFLTNIFLHGGFLHIILNMWTLWIFGPALEDRLGPIRFALLYSLAGIAASVTHAVFNATSSVPALGASGAIAGTIAAYAIRFPYAWVRVLVLVVFIPLFFSVPAMLFASIWFFTQILQGTSELLSPYAGSGIAWWAHIGGFISGWILLHWLERTGRPAARYNGGPWER
jgi:membrane associated rhomboid family serine protease